ncbi:MAG: hypothetical protein P8129_23905 [Anaerolineae bacterium]
MDPNAGQASRPEHRNNQYGNPVRFAEGQPIIALSAKWHAYPQRLHWIAEHGFALEYAPNLDSLDLFPQRIAPFLQAGVPLRYHGFFPGHEFAHADPEAASRGLDVHLSVLEVMPGLGEPVITVHIGLHSQDPLDADRAVEHLARLVERGRQLGITVCLENLRQGPTSDPETVVEWAVASGAMITLGPIVDRLIGTKCRWWTIELDDYDEALATRALLLDYLSEANPKSERRRRR